MTRVTMLRGATGQVGDGIRRIREDVLPRAEQLDGYEGTYILVDHENGNAIKISLWSSEEARRASEEAGEQLRKDAAEALGLEIASVERYEVVLSPQQGSY